MKRLLVLLLAVVLLGLHPSPAQAAPVSGAYFNTPKPWGTVADRFRIIRNVEAALNGVRSTDADGRRAVIYVATYFLDRKASVDALINAACKRKVSVRIVLDGKIDNPQARRLVTTLNADNPTSTGQVRRGPCNTAPPAGARGAGTDELPLMSTAEAERSVAEVDDTRASWGADASYVTSCSGSCRGGGGNMHAKFFVMSNSGGAQDVSIISSSNLNEGGALKGWNDAFSVSGRPVLFNQFAKMHLQMTDDKNVAGRGRNEVVEGPFTLRFFPMMGAGRANDPVMADLNKIKCRGPMGRTQVRISMFYWAGTRGVWLADKVIGLGRAGCDVRVIYGAPSKEIRLKLRAAAVKKQIQVFDSRVNRLPDGTFATRTHGKYVAVRGVYGSNQRASVVMTGSPNWTGGSLSIGDEVTLNIETAAAYNQYLRNWNLVRKHSVKIPARGR